MARKTAAHKSATRDVESGRYERAVTEAMRVSPVADRMYEAESAKNGTYTVDLSNPACECADFQYRESFCKHLIRASLADVFYSGTVRTRSVAEVVQHAVDNPCPHDCDCDGPAGPRLPCPGCMEACCIRPQTDEYDVWKLTLARLV